MKRSLILMSLLFGIAGVAFSQDPATSANDDAWKRQMEQKIDALTQELEKSKLAPAEQAGVAADVNPNAAISLSPYSVGPAAGKVYGVDKGLSIGGYGELIYQHFDRPTAYSINGDSNQPRRAELNLARFVLYFGYRFSDKILFNSELEVENANSSKSGEVEAEFAFLDFALSKPFGVRVGELLLPVGLTNEYHEPPVFHGVLRPDVEQFLIPTTWHENGAGYYGQAGPVAYRGYVVAGLRAAQDEDMGQTGLQPDIGLQEARQEGSNSRAQDLGYVQRIDFTGVPGFIFGGSGYTGNTGQGDTTHSGEEIRAPLTLWEVHTQGSFRGFEMRGLYTQTHIADVAEINDANDLSGNQSVGKYMWGGYAELAYNVMNLFAPTSQQYVSPFFRYERYNTQAKVPDGFSSDPANDRTTYTMGVNYKPIPRVVLKADYQVRHNAAGTGVNQFNLGTGYEF